jgi:hypothetical protein
MRWKFISTCAALLLLCGGLVYAQGTQTGLLRGTVTTSDHLSLPGATVTISSPALQGERTTVTESDGTFLFRGLPPGLYTVSFEMSGMQSVSKSVQVPLGQVAVVDTVMGLANVTEAVTVTAAATVLTTPTVGANIKHEEVEQLATRRDLEGIANLAPAVTESTAPNSGQLNINGSFAYDNLFMINGVDVNDNLYGSPQNVFIEDAIQETQVLTSGITAEYGRFSGGVVNAITRSGGNTFSGSVRLNLNNPTWSTRTPYEVEHDVNRTSVLNKIYEGTFGGPVLRDRLWFFTAGRYQKTTASRTLPVSGSGYDSVTNNKRGELKLTGSANSNHTFTVNYITNPTTEGPRPAIGGYEIDNHTFVTRDTPNNMFGASWRGVLRSNMFAEAQFSQRHFSFLNAGGTSTDIHDSPFFSRILGGGGYEYNAPYFDATDPEDRNNRQFSASLSSTFEGAGRHDVKGGWEWYRSTRTGGNSQSATSLVFETDYVTASPDTDEPLYDANGYIIPVFTPGLSRLQNWLATRGAELNSDTNSFYLQDHWVATRQLSFDLGLRYETVTSKATGGIIGVDTSTLVPRLAAAFDPAGNGKTVFHVTYGHYSGRYNDAQIGANTAVGNPALLYGVYTGPAGQGRDFEPGLDPNNYLTFYGSFPTANVFMAPGLSAPVTREFTASAGTELTSKGSAQVTYVWRTMSNFIEDFIDVANGTTNVVQNGQDFGTFTNIRYENTDAPRRDYQGLVFQASYRFRPNWQVAGNYTLQIENDGNFSGEAQNEPGISSVYGDYPVAGLPTIYTRGWADGHLYDFQRHKLRAWTIYQFNLGRLGRLSASGLVRADSGLTYSLVANGVEITPQQQALLDAAGYIDPPTDQSVYFGDRGSQFYPGFALFDTSFNYDIPVFKELRPWLKFDIYNLFNNQKLISYVTTVTPAPDSPLDAMGLPTEYVKSGSFGQARGAGDYPQAFQGQNGGRTFRVAFGLRW